MIKFISLNKNQEFKKILKKKKLDTNYFTVYFAKKKLDKQRDYKKNLNISFVAKKKIGNAVKRNKIKRKLKAAVQQLLEKKKVIDLNQTYVIFGKKDTYKDKFSLILNETNKAFKKIKQMEL